MQEWTVTLQVEENTNTKREDTYLKYASKLSSGGNINNFFFMFIYKLRYDCIKNVPKQQFAFTNNRHT
jgi:hypothetical protein